MRTFALLFSVTLLRADWVIETRTPVGDKRMVIGESATKNQQYVAGYGMVDIIRDYASGVVIRVTHVWKMYDVRPLAMGIAGPESRKAKKETSLGTFHVAGQPCEKISYPDGEVCFATNIFQPEGYWALHPFLPKRGEVLWSKGMSGGTAPPRVTIYSVRKIVETGPDPAEFQPPPGYKQVASIYK